MGSWLEKNEMFWCLYHFKLYYIFPDLYVSYLCLAGHLLWNILLSNAVLHKWVYVNTCSNYCLIVLKINCFWSVSFALSVFKLLMVFLLSNSDWCVSSCSGHSCGKLRVEDPSTALRYWPWFILQLGKEWGSVYDAWWTENQSAEEVHGGG